MKKFFLCISVILTQVVQVQALEGDLNWSNTFGNSSMHVSYDSVSTNDGGYIVVGDSNASIDGIQPFRGSSDFLIYKIDSDGNIVWNKNYGGSGSDTLLSVTKTTDGNFVAAGYSSSVGGNLPANKGGSDFILFKFDNVGNIIWIKNYGGSLDDTFNSVIVIADGSMIAAGSSKSLNGDVPANKGNDDMVLAKFDANGNKVWVKNYGGSGADMFSSVIETRDGGFAVSGNSTSSNGNLTKNYGSSDAVVAKLDASGNLTWMRSFGSNGTEFVPGLVEAPDESLIVAGSTTGVSDDIILNKGGTNDMVLAKFDSSGNKLWIKTYGGSSGDELRSLLLTKDNYLIAAGYSGSKNGDMPSSIQLDDGLIAKFDLNGNKIWFKNFGSANNERIQSVRLEKTGKLIAVGTQNNNVDYGRVKIWYVNVEYERDPTKDKTPVNLGFQGTSLQLIAPIGTPTFSGVMLNGTSQTVYAPLAPLIVRDYSATFNGYHVTMQASTLLERAPDGVWDTEGVRLSLPQGSLKIKPPTSINIVYGSVNAPTNQLSASTIIDGGSSVKILSADVGKGMGDYQIHFDLNALELYITAHTKVDTINYPGGNTVYESTLTWSIISGP